MKSQRDECWSFIRSKSLDRMLLLQSIMYKSDILEKNHTTWGLGHLEGHKINLRGHELITWERNERRKKDILIHKIRFIF